MCALLVITLIHPVTVHAAPQVTSIQTNTSNYPNNQVPKFNKIELTFNVSTVAQNTFYPFDTNPPAGLPASTGITVNAKFTAPDGQVYQQPAFYYQNFDDQVKGTQEWFYPSNNYAWKVRFSPHLTGTWRYTLIVKDASGTVETPSAQFTVTDSLNHGFVKVSADPRYFEFQDGTYFPALGFNLGLGEVDATNPVLGNTEEFTSMNRNGIQLSRVWVSQNSIYGEAWGRWHSNNRFHLTQEERMGIVAPNNNQFAQFYPGFTPPALPQGSEYYAWLEYNTVADADGQQTRFTPCRYMYNVPVKQNTAYRVKVRFQTKDLEGPKVAGHPYGFAVKTTSENWAVPLGRCNDHDAGPTVAASYNTSQVQADTANPGWMYLTNTFTTSSSDFIRNFYLTFDNVGSQDGDTKAGHVFIDEVWLEEAGCTSNCANLISKPRMSMHQYINQRDAYNFDKALNLAEQQGIYLKAVMNEKNDRIFQTIDFNGNTVATPSVANFYGNRRVVTKVRWLQQAWWRYMQARWGYSPNIHSWELLNEGSLGNAEGHWDMADEFGKYMKCRVFDVAVSSANPYEKCQYRHPNSHMVSTSFFNGGFPWSFWNNQQGGVPSTFAEMDYADQHYYSHPGDTSALAGYYDSAQFSYNLSMQDGTFAPGKRKPFMRGEAGWHFDAPAPRDLFADNSDNGEWLHDYIWAGLNPGGLMEHYFAGLFGKHIYDLRGSSPHDHRPMFKPYYNFVKDIPLNNGRYVNADAIAADSNIRAWGQKDTTSGRAHLWIANKNHTWYNAMGGFAGGPAVTAINPISTTVTIPGFAANTAYPIEWWDTYTGQPTTSSVQPTTTVTSDASGNVRLSVTGLTKDVAVRIGSYSTSTPATLPGDMDRDRDVDIYDYSAFVTKFGTTDPTADFNRSGLVDIYDYNELIRNFGNRL